MLIPKSATHLTYCMNVHPAKDLVEVLDNLRTHAAAVADRVADGRPFGIGLWLPASAIANLRRDATPISQLLKVHNLYLVTINGFPYGPFHGTSVKTSVYQPDWGSRERLDYTKALFEIMAQVLPSGVPGSISTVPITYGKILPPAAFDHLAEIHDFICDLRASSGRKLSLALEPEPDCYLEDTPETIAFFERLRDRIPNLGDVIGVCFDTCHVALQHEDLATSWQALMDARISVPKVQLSAALTCDNRDGLAARARLEPYAEPVYLHQTRITAPDDTRTRFPDLPAALAANTPGEWLIHYHVPLPFAGDGALGTTGTALTPDLLRRMVDDCPCLEVETYTFDVLPAPKPDVVTSISNELAWVQRQLNC